MSDSEHRRQVRVSKNLLAIVQHGYIQFLGFIVDIAKGGMGMTCNRDIALGDALSISLNVPEHKTLKLAGHLVWRRELPKLSRNRWHLGVRLSNPPEEYAAYVESLMRREYERRAHRRFADTLIVSNEDVLDLLDATTQDISAGGLYIRTGSPLPVGAQYEVDLQGSGLLDPLRCLVEVVTSFDCDADDLDHPYGAGVKIISFRAGDAERFADYIKQLESLFRFHWPTDIPKPPEIEIEIEADDV